MPQRFQFSLRTLLVATVASAMMLAVVLAIAQNRHAARPAIVLVVLGAVVLLPCFWVASFRWRAARGNRVAAPSLLLLVVVGAALGAMLPFFVVWLLTMAMRP